MRGTSNSKSRTQVVNNSNDNDSNNRRGESSNNRSKRGHSGFYKVSSQS